MLIFYMAGLLVYPHKQQLSGRITDGLIFIYQTVDIILETGLKVPFPAPIIHFFSFLRNVIHRDFDGHPLLAYSLFCNISGKILLSGTGREAAINGR